MKRISLAILALVAAVNPVAGVAYATMDLQKEFLKQYPDSKMKCGSCHTKAMPKKGEADVNKFGADMAKVKDGTTSPPSTRWTATATASPTAPSSRRGRTPAIPRPSNMKRMRLGVVLTAFLLSATPLRAAAPTPKAPSNDDCLGATRTRPPRGRTGPLFSSTRRSFPSRSTAPPAPVRRLPHGPREDDRFPHPRSSPAPTVRAATRSRSRTTARAGTRPRGRRTRPARPPGAPTATAHTTSSPRTTRPPGRTTSTCRRPACAATAIRRSSRARTGPTAASR